MNIEVRLGDILFEIVSWRIFWVYPGVLYFLYYDLYNCLRAMRFMSSIEFLDDDDILPPPWMDTCMAFV